jgi:hypothetical protein
MKAGKFSFANRLNAIVPPLLSDAWLDESEKQMKKTLNSGNSSSQMCYLNGL